MNSSILRLCSLYLAFSLFCSFGATPDWRRFSEGNEIPSEGYCDQPYVVLNSDGSWLCVMTTGAGKEGQSGQHVVSTISSDKGETWTPLIDIEPADGPAASWVMPLMTPSGRAYVFYTYNGDRLTSNGSLSGSSQARVDTQGDYAYKYSDDGGRTWSCARYQLPLRNLDFDYKNPLGPGVHLFWGIGKPIIDGGDVFLGAAKIAYFGNGFMAEDRGIIFHSPNVLTERDPERHQWEMLPERDHGLASVNGPVCDEHNLVSLSDGSLYAMARTVEGHPVHYYSRDRGRTWTDPEYATYTPGGQKFRHPRACPRLWKTSNGRYLFWFHNNGHRWYNSNEAAGSRNVAWLSAGIEKHGHIYWSQPEIVRYVDNATEGASYPDLIEQDGRFFITATQKTTARVGEIPGEWLRKLFRQTTRTVVEREGLTAEFSPDQLRPGASLKMPSLPNLAEGGGFTIDLWLEMIHAEPDQVLLDSTSGPGTAGVTLRTKWLHQLELTITDGERTFTWDTDRGLVGPDEKHHVSFIVDGGPKLLSTVVDGHLCDGGGDNARKYGYGRFHQSLYSGRGKVERREEIGNVTGGSLKVLPKALETTKIHNLRIYKRPIMTTEAIGNSRAGY